VKKYYRITQSFQDSYGIATELNLPPDPEKHISTCLAGREIRVPVPNPLEIDLKHLKKDENPRHFIQSARLIIISNLLLKVLKESGVDNFQIFPVVLKDPKTKRTWNNYYAFNELGLLDAALLKECEYDVLDEGDKKLGILPLYSFDTVVLSAKKLKKEPKMFRIIHDPGQQLYLSEDVIPLIDKLSPPEKWGIRFEEKEPK
jgi:hypothetical protein